VAVDVIQNLGGLQKTTPEVNNPRMSGINTSQVAVIHLAQDNVSPLFQSQTYYIKKDRETVHQRVKAWLKLM
jgi:hypothetical protein